MVDQDDIFVERVRKDLSAILHRPVEEINASASAWAISNEDGFLHSRGTFNSDYLLLVLNSGDLDQPFSRLSDVVGAETTRPSSAIGDFFIKFGAMKSQFFRNDAGTTVEHNPDTEQANLRELSRMVNFTRSKRCGFLLVFVPFRWEVAHGASSSAPDALSKWAGSENIDLIDLTGSVSPYETKAITLRDGIHYNSRGNRLLADSLDRYLADKFRPDYSR
jgi:hypothetical protein